MEGIHPGSFWRVLNPYPTQVDDPDNADLFPTARGPTVPEDKEEPATLSFSKTFNCLQFSTNSWGASSTVNPSTAGLPYAVLGLQ